MEPEQCESAVLGRETLELGREEGDFDLNEKLKDAEYELNKAEAEWELGEEWTGLGWEIHMHRICICSWVAPYTANSAGC